MLRPRSLMCCEHTTLPASFTNGSAVGAGLPPVRLSALVS
jgi:hypothetical protein